MTSHNISSEFHPDKLVRVSSLSQKKFKYFNWSSSILRLVLRRKDSETHCPGGLVGRKLFCCIKLLTQCALLYLFLLCIIKMLDLTFRIAKRLLINFIVTITRLSSHTPLRNFPAIIAVPLAQNNYFSWLIRRFFKLMSRWNMPTTLIWMKQFLIFQHKENYSTSVHLRNKLSRLHSPSIARRNKAKNNRKREKKLPLFRARRRQKDETRRGK